MPPAIHQEGYVACTAQFEPGQAVEQLGDVRFDGDLTAVRKQSCILPLTRLEDGDDPAAVYSDGNTLTLVNTRVSNPYCDGAGPNGWQATAR